MEQNTHQRELSSDNFLNPLDIFRNKINELKYDELTFIEQKLSRICLDFDPFNPNHEDTELNTLLAEFELIDEANNPYTFTRILLQMMDITETTKKSREH